MRAIQTTRTGGVSQGGYRSLNLAGHVGDRPEHVETNRGRLEQAVGLPGPVRWMQQVHGKTVAAVDRLSESGPVPEADAATAHSAGVVCGVLTADCLPLLLCARGTDAVAAVHAGWRGLAAGVVEETVAALDCPPDRLMAWLGPAIGPAHFEVGPEVREAFLQQDRRAQEAFRAATVRGGWYADLYHLARLTLQRAGLADGNIRGGGFCTYTDSTRFFSYRRDGECGRMASLVWVEP